MGLLAGIKVIEMAGLTPGPFCGLMLADIRPRYGLSDLYLGISSARAVFILRGRISERPTTAGVVNMHVNARKISSSKSLTCALRCVFV